MFRYVKLAFTKMFGQHVPVQALQYDYLEGRRLAVSSSQANGGVFSSEHDVLIRICTTTDVFYSIGTDPVAGDGSSNAHLPAGGQTHEIIPAGHKIVLTRAGTVDGSVFILPAATP